MGNTARGKANNEMAASGQSCMNITVTSPTTDNRSLPRLVNTFDTAPRMRLMS